MTRVFRYRYLAFGLLILLLLPFLLLNEEVVIRIHDNLDSEFVYLHVLKLNDLLFSFDNSLIVPNIINGLPRAAFHSEFSFVRFWFLILPSFWAYIANSIFVRLIGLTGVIVLSEELSLSKSKKLEVSILAISFALMPVYTLYGISVLGLPLVFWAVLNLYKGQRLSISMGILTLFPFYAHIAMVAPFILAVFVLFILYLYFKTKAMHRYLLFGFMLLLGSFLLANAGTLSNFVSPIFTSHRSEWYFPHNGVYDIFKDAFHTLLWGQYHSSVLFNIPIIAIVTISLFIKQSKFKKQQMVLLTSILLISLWQGFYPIVRDLLHEDLQLLTTFQFNRFTFLLPLISLLMLLLVINEKYINKWIIRFILVINLVFTIFSNQEVFANYLKFTGLENNYTVRKTASSILNKLHDKGVNYSLNVNSFNDYYDSERFTKIANYIDAPLSNYRVVSFAIDPSISIYNGFYALDGYLNNYPLEYKLKFREVIADEIERNQAIKTYFDSWGSRCYMFSSETGRSGTISGNARSQPISRLLIDTDALRELGCSYIISGVLIPNATSLNISLLKEFHKDDSFPIFLYKI